MPTTTLTAPPPLLVTIRLPATIFLPRPDGAFWRKISLRAHTPLPLRTDAGDMETVVVRVYQFQQEWAIVEVRGKPKKTQRDQTFLVALPYNTVILTWQQRLRYQFHQRMGTLANRNFCLAVPPDMICATGIHKLLQA